MSVLDLVTMERRTISGMAASAVAWMPDGEGLLVAAPAPDGASAWIWRLPIGGGLPEPIMAGGADWHSPSPSPDGSMVAAIRRSSTGWELIVRDLEQSVDRVVARRAVIRKPRWSPDGRYLAWSGYERPEDFESGGVWVSEVFGGKPRRLTLDGAWPVWEAGGTHLLFGRFLHNRGSWRVALAGGSPQLVRTLEPDMKDLYLEGLDTGSSGTPILFTLSTHTGELYMMEPPD